MLSSARVAIAALAFALAAPALAQQGAVDPEVGSLVCELSGDCGPAAAAPTADAPKGARTSSTRGFTFKRTAPAAGLGAPAAPAMAATASATTRSANLKLDFASGSAMLMPTSRARLAKLASALSAPQLSGKRMRIEGHTDASGSPAANKELSQRRAQATADYLKSMGVDSARLEVIGYGSSRLLPGVPATSGDNRRVMAVVLN